MPLSWKWYAPISQQHTTAIIAPGITEPFSKVTCLLVYYYASPSTQCPIAGFAPRKWRPPFPEVKQLCEQAVVLVLGHHELQPGTYWIHSSLRVQDHSNGYTQWAKEPGAEKMWWGLLRNNAIRKRMGRPQEKHKEKRCRHTASRKTHLPRLKGCCPFCLAKECCTPSVSSGPNVCLAPVQLVHLCQNHMDSNFSKERTIHDLMVFAWGYISATLHLSKWSTVVHRSATNFSRNWMKFFYYDAAWFEVWSH